LALLLLTLELSKSSSLEPSWGTSVKKAGEELLRPCAVYGFLLYRHISGQGISSHYFFEDRLGEPFQEVMGKFGASLSVAGNASESFKL
jgi:hypothetical protein